MLAVEHTGTVGPCAHRDHKEIWVFEGRLWPWPLNPQKALDDIVCFHRLVSVLQEWADFTPRSQYVCAYIGKDPMKNWRKGGLGLGGKIRSSSYPGHSHWQ
jgi:hypothetical protein